MVVRKPLLVEKSPWLLYWLTVLYELVEEQVKSSEISKYLKVHVV